MLENEEVQSNQEENIKEQPNQVVDAQAATAENKILGENSPLDEGSLPSKFKSTESLVEAYNALQAEFTRKSQKLSEVSKELSQVKENAGKKPTPLYERENWEKTVEEFFTTNPSAKEYATEISEQILSGNMDATAPQSLELAWAKILANKFNHLDNLLEEDKFVTEHILKNPNINDKIIKNYLQSLQGNKTIPVISTHTGSSFSLAPKNKPNNLEEARVLAEALFKI